MFLWNLRTTLDLVEECGGGKVEQAGEEIQTAAVRHADDNVLDTS